MNEHNMTTNGQTDRIGCAGCGIKITDPGENPDPDALLCDTCYQDGYGVVTSKELTTIPQPEVEHFDEQKEDSYWYGEY